MSSEQIEMARRAGLIGEELPPAIRNVPMSWDDTIRALEKNPGSKAQALAKKFRQKYKLTENNGKEEAISQ